MSHGSDGSTTQVLVGNKRLLAESGLVLDESVESILRTLDDQGETPLIVAVDGTLAGVIGLRDTVRAEAHDVIHDLKHLGITQFAILTGDREPVARRVAKKVHVKTVASELLPADKARWIKEQQEAGRTVAMVGDGINDAPALAQADAGIALGGMGADLAADAGDLILLGDPLRKLPELVELSRATVRVIRQNIIGFAFGLNALAVLLASLGILSPVAAAIFHQIGSLLVLLNAMRLLVFGDWAELPPFRQLRSLGARINRIDDAVDLDLVWTGAAGIDEASSVVLRLVPAIFYAVSGIQAIGPGEVGLVQRFGGFRELLAPGLHVRFPEPIERVTRVEPGRVRGLDVGFQRGAERRGEPLRWEARHGRNQDQGDTTDGDALLLTGDGQFLEVTASVQYVLDAARPGAIRRFVLELDDPEGTLQVLAQSAVRKVVSRRKLVDLLTRGRREAEEAATRLLREEAARIDLGVLIQAVTFQDVASAARRGGRLSRRLACRERSATAGQRGRGLQGGKADGRRSPGSGREGRRRGGSRPPDRPGVERLGCLRLSDRRARQAAPSLTDFRLFWETIAEVLSGKPKLILDGGVGRHQRLVLSRLPLESGRPSERGKQAGIGREESERRSGTGNPSHHPESN